MSGSVLSMSGTAEAPLALVGGKSRTLARLRSAGFRVPVGVVITSDAVLGGVMLAPSLIELGPGPYAVRSSGVSEDGAERSLAGRYQSILDVESDLLMDAVSRVREFARRKDGERIAVLVQSMVHPVCAGVAFTADPVTGDRLTTIVTATRGVADRLVSGQVAGDEWYVTGRKAKPLRRPERVLSRRLVRRVARVAALVETELGGPQDVEWAWDGRHVWVVQARPITRLPEGVTWEPPEPGIYHRSFRFGEWLPEPLTPLFESWLLTRMEKRLHEFISDQVGQIAPEPLHVTVNGWYYYSMNWMPAPGVALTRNLIRILPRLPKNWRKVAGMFPQTARFGYRLFEAEWRQDFLPKYRAAVADAEQRVETVPTGELISMIDGLSDLAGFYFAWMAVVAGSAYKMENQLALFWNRHLKVEIGLSHMVLLQGLSQSKEIRGTPQLETLDWHKPSMIPNTASSNYAALKAQRLDTEKKAEAILAGSPRRLARFRRLLSDAQHLEPVREEQVSQLSLPWPVMRRAVLRLGDTLQAGGSINTVDSVFYLTRSEVVSLLGKPTDTDKLIDSRREQRIRASRLAAPLIVGRVPPIVKMVFSFTAKALGATRSEHAILHGVPASPGRATGRVRVIRDSSQFDTLQQGEILVAPLTAPAWTELFSRSAAVVTDVGNALAHASIIAREYGIPAVVGCGDATSRLRDGQMVTVDGSSGNVEPAAS